MEYSEWFIQQWNSSGGLIPQVQASKILKKSRTRIRQMINEKKLTPYAFKKGETPLLSFAEIMKLKNSNP